MTFPCRVIEVDLKNGERRIQAISEDVQRSFLGGRGLNMAFLYSNLNPNIDPLSANNPMIIGTGMLTGTGAINACRMNITSQSPESGFLGDANIGGYFGAEMRYAGAEMLVITNRAEKLSYLLIQNGIARIVSAEHLRGLDTVNTQLKLRQELGEDIECLVIGPAGENLVRYACIVHGIKNAAGRCGLGAVMGAKNLKAIVVKGHEGIDIHSPDELLKLNFQLKDHVWQSTSTKELHHYGTAYLYDKSEDLGAIRSYNAQLNAFSDALKARNFNSLVEKMLACSGCVIHCRRRNTKGGEGPEYSTIGALGANCGIDDPEKIVVLGNICNQLGLDTSSTGGIISWFIELKQRDLLGKYADSFKVKFGDFEGIRELIYQIANRDGIGDVLAEGIKAQELLPQEAKRYLIAVKGRPQSDPHDPRYAKGFALGIAVSSRGADHLRNRPTMDFLDIPSNVKKRIFKIENVSAPDAYEGKAEMVIYHEDLFAVNDSSGLCRFVCHAYNSPGLIGYDQLIDLIKAVSGMEFSREELEKVGKRIINLERMINIRLGLKKEDDTLPTRYFDEPALLKKAKWQKIDREKFKEMLSRYYQLRNWNSEGHPPDDFLLGIPENILNSLIISKKYISSEKKREDEKG